MLEPEVNAAQDPLPPCPAETSLQAIARPVFLGWEKLRVGYLVLLAAWCRGLYVAGGSDGDEGRFWATCIFGGIIANLCYFAGPLVETYVVWLTGRHHAWLRPVLYSLGALLTMLLALVALFDVAMLVRL